MHCQNVEIADFFEMYGKSIVRFNLSSLSSSCMHARQCFQSNSDMPSSTGVTVEVVALN
jgi:hypothetical protein